MEDVQVPTPADASPSLDSATLADVVDASIIGAAGADSVTVSCLGDDRGTWMRVTPRRDVIIIDGKDYEAIVPFHMEVQLAPCSTVDLGVGQMKQGIPH